MPVPPATRRTVLVVGRTWPQQENPQLPAPEPAALQAVCAQLTPIAVADPAAAS